MNDADIDDRTKEIKEYPRSILTDTSLQLHLLGCLFPRFYTVRHRNDTHPEILQDEVLALTSQISNACREGEAYAKEGDGQVFQHNLMDPSYGAFFLPFIGLWHVEQV